MYTQIEMLKVKNMKVGNPHLNKKLSAIAEAASSSMGVDNNYSTASSFQRGDHEIPLLNNCATSDGVVSLVINGTEV